MQAKEGKSVQLQCLQMEEKEDSKSLDNVLRGEDWSDDEVICCSGTKSKILIFPVRGGPCLATRTHRNN